MSEHTPTDVLTLEEAAPRLRIAPKTLRDWVRSGKFPGFKLGRKWLVKVSAVEQAIEAAEARQQRPVLVPNDEEGA